jgi:acetyltransferase
VYKARPRPYPANFVRQVELKCGAKLILRPIKPDDEALWHALLQRSSPQSLWQRFGFLFKESTHEMAIRFCYPDYGQTMAIVAETTVCGEACLVAVGRLEADPDHDRPNSPSLSRMNGRARG